MNLFVSAEIARARKNLCRICEHVNRSSQGGIEILSCGLCQCPHTKVYSAIASCPIGKWASVVSAV